MSCLTQTRKIFRDDPDVQHLSTLHTALEGKTVHTLNGPTREAAVAANSRRRICSGSLGPKCCSPLTSGAASNCSVATAAALIEGNRALQCGEAMGQIASQEAGSRSKLCGMIAAVIRTSSAIGGQSLWRNTRHHCAVSASPTASALATGIN